MSDHGLLHHRAALVTGAAQGIGAATAMRFGEEGADVALTDIDLEGAERQAAELRENGINAVALQLDVTNREAVRQTVEEIAATFGRLDLVVANAGIGGTLPFDETSVDFFDRTLRVNVTGVFNVFQCALPHLRAARGGQLLATSSLAGKAGVPFMSAYAASKFALIGLIESLAKELGPEGIRVCAVAPGFVDTPLLAGELTAFRAAQSGETHAQVREHFIKSIPLGRLIAPEEVANAFVYLASPLASGVNGELLTVSGGGT